MLGAELGSWNVSSGFPPPFVTSGQLTSITGITGITLTAGDTYDLQVSGLSSLWNENDQNLLGEHLNRGIAVGFTTLTGAFDVLSDVPEPATWTMMILGLGLVGFAARRRRKGTAIRA